LINPQRGLGVSWDVDLYGELLKIGGGKERYFLLFLEEKNDKDSD